MNRMEGRIGRQEAASLGWIACMAGGVFAFDSAALYEGGNSSYLSAALAVAFALLAAYFVAGGMKRSGCTTLAALYRRAFGRALSVPAALCTSLALLWAASEPLTRVLHILFRYVYSEAEVGTVGLYFLPCLLYLAWKGLETLGRTARLLVLALTVSVLITFVIASSAFDVSRLFPLPGRSVWATLYDGARGIGCFLPAFLALFVCGRGVHGVRNALLGARVGALGGGATAVASRFCLSLLYPHAMLMQMDAPMYRATMSVRTGNPYLRTDKLLLFFWTTAGLISGGFLIYAAALLYADTLDIRDVRPAAAAMACVAAGLAVFGCLTIPWFESITAAAQRIVWIAALLPPLLAAGLASIGAGRRA